MVVSKETRLAEGVGMGVAVQRGWNVCFADGVAICSTCMLGFRPCQATTHGRGESFILKMGGMSGGGESIVVHSGWPEMVRSVVRDGGNRGGGRSITALYVLCCSVGWMAFNVGDMCPECIEIGPEFGELGVG